LVVRAFNDAEHFVFAHDEVILTIELDLLAGILAEQDRVARLHVEGDALAVVFGLPGADGDHLALLGLLFGGVGDDDAADFLFAFIEALDNDAVVQRSDVHALYSVRRKGVEPSGLPTESIRYWRLALAKRDC